MTRFGEISSLWQKNDVFVYFKKVYLLFGNFLSYRSNFHSFK